MAIPLNPLAVYFELVQLGHSEKQNLLSEERNQMAREDQAISLEQLKLAYRAEERDIEKVRLSQRAELRDEEKLKLYNLRTMMDLERYKEETIKESYRLFTSEDVDRTIYLLRSYDVEKAFGYIVLWYKGNQCKSLSITEAQLFVIADNASRPQMQEVVDTFITCALKGEEDISKLDALLQHMAPCYLSNLV